MWLFRSKPAEGEEEEYEDDDGSYEDDDEEYPENSFEYETGEEGDDEASKYKNRGGAGADKYKDKAGRPASMVALGKDFDSVADSSMQLTALSTFTTASNNDNNNNNGNDNNENADASQEKIEKGYKREMEEEMDVDYIEARNNGNSPFNGNGAAGKGNNPFDEHENEEDEVEEEEEDHDMDTVVVDDDSRDGGIPENVDIDESDHDSRFRLPSALTMADHDDFYASFAGDSGDEVEIEKEEDTVEEEKEEVKEEEPEEEEEEVTSMAEKQSLLVLAAEHDRVDILQAILSDESNDRSTLLHATSCTSIPPLHIAVGYGSVGATNCLLRMGADPSLRPDVKAIQKEQKRQESPVDISNMARYDNVTAWELVFGCGDGVGDKKAGWSIFGASPSKVKDDDDEEQEAGGLSDSIRSTQSTRSVRKPPRSVAPVTMAPSKREGIRHAFTAEALRCIGSDEVDRLRQLIDSGMPMSIDIGGKNLYDWSVEMSATQCEILLRPSATATDNDGETTVEASNDSDKHTAAGDSNTTDATTAGSNKKTAVLDRPGDEPAMHLVNRLDELESLSKALSICLDNLAEEVSVSHGLLLMGGGASALASHVRSLKALKERKYEEFIRMQEAWENSDDELAYWVKESGDQGKRIADLLTSSLESTLTRKKSLPEATSPEEEKSQTQQLQAQIWASENKIRKLRVAIADLSEENSRNLKEVEKRGLSGGITLVRGLREEIRDTEFELFEAKSAEAACRTKISLIQSSLLATKKHPPGKDSKQDSSTSTSEQPVDGQAQEATAAIGGSLQAGAESTDPATTFSERIATGESTAIVVRTPGNRGFFPISLWQILLRIIGMGDEPPPRTSDSSITRSTMII